MDLDRDRWRVLDRDRVLDREMDLLFFLALSLSSFSFNSFSNAAKGSSMTLQCITRLSLLNMRSESLFQLVFTLAVV